MPSSKQPLPPKEQAMFKKILRHYEMKQYKHGLKAAKYILSQPKFADHGETLALKGLTLNCLNRKTEAYELVKKGIKNDFQSHICWHVYGLLYRSDKDYTQAIKCYRSALRFDKDNVQILRDLSLLQIQMRDLKGFKSTRHSLLMMNPERRASWLGYVLALHLLGEYDEAVKVLTTYEKTHTDDLSGPEAAYEKSELILYKISMLMEEKNTEEALKTLDEKDEDIKDRLAVEVVRAEMLLKLGRQSEAEALARTLLSRNVENADYYALLERCLEITDGSPVEERLKMYQDVLENRPKAHAPKRLPLFFTSGDLFRKLVDEYLRPNIRKGMSPVFRNIRKTYTDDSKRVIVETLGENYLQNLRKSPSKFDEKAVSKTEPPTTLIWTLYFMAQHWDFVGDTKKAMTYINEAIDHTPTILELYMVKAKIYKHMGNVTEAAHWLNYARELDTADRFINSKCVKYMLRAGEIEKAEETAGLFTRETNDPIAQLSEMQCIWFETEEALAFERKGDIGKALKKLHLINDHFDQMIEDQFDFHSYCLRKMTLRAYIDMLRAEDRLRHHTLYIKAALTAIHLYINLHDVPFGSKERVEQEARLSGMTASERKKMLSKQKKKAAKARRAELEKDKAGPGSKKKGSSGAAKEGAAGDAAQTDEDPDGTQLAKTAAPLDEALKFLRPLLLHAPTLLKVQTAAFELYYRRQRPLLMLQALKRAVDIDASHSSVARVTGLFLKYYDAHKDEMHAVVRQVIDEELLTVAPGGGGADAFVEAYVQANGTALEDVVVGAFLTWQVQGKKDAAAEMLVQVDLDAVRSNVAACRDALDLLDSVTDATNKSKFLDACKKKYEVAEWGQHDLEKKTEN